MTQLRNAGRALAISGHQPAGILCELARIADWATSGKYATMAAATIEYTQSQVGLDAGDIVLMYTEGLIERRGEDLADGIARVAEHMTAWRSDMLIGGLCDRLIDSLVTEPQPDDMCVLAIGRQAPSLDELGPGRYPWSAVDEPAGGFLRVRLVFPT